MREIGKIDNELDANVFRDFLYNRGIETELEQIASGAWGVWVHDEDRIEESAGLLKTFLANPQDSQFIQGADGAEKKRAAKAKEEKEFSKRNRGREEILGTYGWAGIGRATLVLMIISVAVTLLIQLGQNKALVNRLAIAETFELPGRGSVYYVNLAEIRRGEIWRLITPMFMHFGWLHILFNMLWLRDLGSMIERIQGARFLLVFIFITAILSNLGQFYMSGPWFGGMSGVVYGLLGYIWMQSRFNPWSGYVLHSFTVQMMMIWFVLCLSGLIGNIANTTHAVGLGVGVAWGIISAKRNAR